MTNNRSLIFLYESYFNSNYARKYLIAGETYVFPMNTYAKGNGFLVRGTDRPIPI